MTNYIDESQLENVAMEWLNGDVVHYTYIHCARRRADAEVLSFREYVCYVEESGYHGILI